jgi:glutaredoxin-dependent peroxiredoxin
VLQVGDKAPEFNLPTTGGDELTLAAALAKHRSLIFLFYVLDFTGGWRTELTEFRSRHEAAAKDGIGIYGISVDSVFSHRAFAEELGGLPFELVGDFERKMVTDYGVRRDDVAGYSGMARRTVYVIDGTGTVTYAWQGSREQPQPDYDLVIEEARKAGGH